MADEIPMIPKAGSFFLHTGNIVNWNRLKRKLTQTPTEELTECIESTVNTWAKETDKTQLQYTTDIECLNKKFLEKLPAEERHEFKLTLKIFLSNLEKATLEEAIDRALCELGTSYIETVLLAFPENKQNLADFKVIWELMEECVHKEKVFSLGVADLNKAQLEELHNWAKVKPSVAQVNLDVCCVVPPEMQAFTKEQDILLLTHNDPADMLPVKAFQDVLLHSLTPRDVENWEPSWVVRYSVLIKSRGIIKTKGYIMKADRNVLKKRN